MPTDFVTYRSRRAPAEIVAMVSGAAPDDEMGLYRMFGGRSKFVSRVRENGFSVYRARIVNRMPATMVANIEPAPGGGCTVATWFEPKPGWREAALDVAFALALILVFAWGTPGYAVPVVIAVAAAVLGVTVLYRCAWERDRSATRAFIARLLQQP